MVPQEALGDGHGGNTWAFVLPPSLQGSSYPLPGLAPSQLYSPPSRPKFLIGQECPCDVCAGRVILFDLCQWLPLQTVHTVAQGSCEQFPVRTNWIWQVSRAPSTVMGPLPHLTLHPSCRVSRAGSNSRLCSCLLWPLGTLVSSPEMAVTTSHGARQP